MGMGIRLSKIVDGTSNTLIVGTLSRDDAIPWMKPEDIVITEGGGRALARRADSVFRLNLRRVTLRFFLQPMAKCMEFSTPLTTAIFFR